MRHWLLIVAVSCAPGKHADAGGTCTPSPHTEPARVMVARQDARFVWKEVWSLSASRDGRFVAAEMIGGDLAVWQADNLLPLWAAHGDGGQLTWDATADHLYQTNLKDHTTTILTLADGTTRTEKFARVPVQRAGATSIVVTADALELRDVQDRPAGKLAFPAGTHDLASLVPAPDGSAIVGVPATPADATASTTAHVIIWGADGKPRDCPIKGAGAHIAGFDTANHRVLVSADAAHWIDVARPAAPQDVAGPAYGVLSPKADRFAFFDQGDVGVIDMNTHRTLWRHAITLNPSLAASDLAFAGDGESLVVGGAGPVTRYDAVTGFELDNAGTRRYAGVVFADDAHLIVTTHDQVTTWDLRTGHRDDERSRYFTNWGAQLYRGDVIVLRDGGRIYDCLNARFLDRWPHGVPPADLDGSLAAFDTKATTTGVPGKSAASAPFCLGGRELHLGAERLLEKAEGGQPYAWTDLDGSHRTPLEQSEHVDSWKLSVLGDHAVATYYDGDKFIAASWGRSGKRVVLPLPVRDDEYVQYDGARVAMREDGKITAIGYGAHVFVYDPATGKHIRTIDTPSLVSDLGFVRDDLLAGLQDGTTRRYAPDGKETAKLAEVIDVAAISPDHKRVAVYPETGGIELRDVATLRPIVRFVERDEDSAWATLTPNGAFDGSDDAPELLSVAFASPARAEPMAAYEAIFRKPQLIAQRLAGKDVDLPAAIARPPTIRFAAPTKLDGSTAHARVHVTSTTGGGDLVAYVDGREKARTAYCGTDSDVAIDVPVAASGRLTLAAVDTQGGTSSVAADVSVTTSTKPHLWAVVVGIGAYQHLPAAWQLHADRDARGLETALRAMAADGHLFAPEAHIKTLVDADATRQAIDSALADLANMKPGDQAIVYLAGHGWRLDNGQMVLVTSSVATKSQAAHDGIAWQTIRDRLEAAPGRVLVLLDACHSGAFSQDLTVVNDRLADELARRGKSGVVVFAAAKGRQYSFEVGASRGHFELAIEEEARAKTKPASKHPPKTPAKPAEDIAGDRDTPVGLFTSAVIAAFASPTTDRNRDGLVQLSELVSAVSARVTEQVTAVGQQQTPNVSHRELFGDFAVGPRL